MFRNDHVYGSTPWKKLRKNIKLGSKKEEKINREQHELTILICKLPSETEY
jgi:hypothetical protein